MAKKKNNKPITTYCPYCGSIAVLRPAKDIYNSVDDQNKKLLVCKNYPECDSYIKVDKNGKPQGVMANKELRQLRAEAHRYFDEIFKNNILSRKDAYKLLSDKLGIPLNDTHMSTFDEYRCKVTIKIAKNILHNHPKTKSKYERK